MLRLAADENFNNNVVRGLVRQKPDIDIIGIQDVNLSGIDDPEILEWAAQQNRVLLTHDVSTITKYAYERIEGGEPMTDVFEVHRLAPIGLVIENILLLVECSFDDEWEDQIIYLPLK